METSFCKIEVDGSSKAICRDSRIGADLRESLLKGLCHNALLNHLIGAVRSIWKGKNQQDPLAICMASVTGNLVQKIAEFLGVQLQFTE
jgi:hypothetical protein